MLFILNTPLTMKSHFENLFEISDFFWIRKGMLSLGGLTQDSDFISTSNWPFSERFVIPT